MFGYDQKVALVVAAHADDEALGVGGTMRRLATDGWDVHVLALTFADSQRRGSVAKQMDMAHAATRLLGVKSMEWAGYIDTQLATVGVATVTNIVRSAIRTYQPSVVFSTFMHDLHGDHRVAGEATSVATRLHWWQQELEDSVRMWLMYEIIGNTNLSVGWPFVPSLYVDISGAPFDEKMTALAEYPTEMNDWPHARSIRAVEHLAHVRGAQAGVDAAEAFQIARCIV
mgnify:CR=1 FL=1